MNSLNDGKNTFHSEVTGITERGFWILVNDREYFVTFQDYPVFRHATVADIFAVKQLSPTQLYWESLGCDIELAALEYPEQFPLIYQPSLSKKRTKRTKSKKQVVPRSKMPA